MTIHTNLVEELTADGREDDLTRHIIDFDPRNPSHYLFAAPPESDYAVTLAKTAAKPDPIPWPEGLAPTATRAPVAPADTDPLPPADVLVVTYTVAEGYALADVLTPGWDTTEWYPYRNGWTTLKKIVHGEAPSLGYNRAGLWATTTVGNASVVTVKSDLHPSTDGAQLPIRALWRQMIEQVKPSLVITTGTAGGVGADTQLGDVIVARHVRWDCTQRFPDQPWAHAAYVGHEKFEPAEFTTAARTLIPVNAKKLPDPTRPPIIWRDTADRPAHTISTDFFAFDDAADRYGLRTYDPHARAVEMDDAALGLACSDLDDPPPWLSIRNASDPQMNASTLTEEKKQAAAIYEKYGQITSWGSALACWAAITEVAKLKSGSQ